MTPLVCDASVVLCTFCCLVTLVVAATLSQAVTTAVDPFLCLLLVNFPERNLLPVWTASDIKSTFAEVPSSASHRLLDTALVALIISDVVAQMFHAQQLGRLATDVVQSLRESILFV